MSSNALKAAVGKAPTPVANFSNYMDRLKPQMALALPKHLNADRMARLAMTAFSSTPALQDCSLPSIAASIMTAAQLGLEPNVNGQGYLIPYGKTCTFVPGWRGLVDLVARAGRASVWTGVVHAGDEFDYQLGDDPFCRHRPGDDGEDEPFTHVYAIGRVKGSDQAVIEVWTRKKVQKHLERYNKVGARHYAKQGENNFEMYARKVALLQVLKYMPQSVELANAAAVSNAAEEGRSAVIEGDLVRVVEPTEETAQDAATGPGNGPAPAPAPAAEEPAPAPAPAPTPAPAPAPRGRAPRANPPQPQPQPQEQQPLVDEQPGPQAKTLDDYVAMIDEAATVEDAKAFAEAGEKALGRAAGAQLWDAVAMAWDGNATKPDGEDEAPTN